MSVVYIVYARFEWLSFERREKHVRPIAEKMKSVTEALDGQIAKSLSQIKEENHLKRKLSPTAKVYIFLSSAIFIVMGVAIYLFVSVIRKVFFNVLIGWKGMALGSLSVMFGKFVQLIAQLTGIFHIPISFVEIFLFPLVLLYQLADFFNIDSLYNLLIVTCEGAKSPIELFIDSFVLGAAILFIKSKYNFLWAMSLQEMNKSILVKYWIEGRKIVSTTFVVSSLAFVLASTNPFITVLRFFLSYVNFGAFFANNHLTHFLSQACVGIEGFQNQELYLVNSTSVLVWWLLAPMLYMTAEIVCPKGGFTSSRDTAPFFGNHQPSYSVMPLLPQQDIISDGSSSIGSFVISEYDSDSIGSVFVSELSEQNYYESASTAAIERNNCADHSNDDNSYEYEGGDEVSPGSLRNREVGSGDSIEYNIVDCSAGSSVKYHPKEVGIRLTVTESQKEDDLELSGVAFATELNHPVLTNRPLPNNRIRTMTMGILRYVLSYTALVFSIDLLYLYSMQAWATHCQKLNDLEQRLMLRSHRRWDHQTIQQSIDRFRNERLNTSKWRHFKDFFTSYETSSREVVDSVKRKWYDVTHQPESAKLPPYYQLCYLVQQEFHRKMIYLKCFWIVSMPLSYIVAFSGVGHLLTIVGRKNWGIAIWKFYLFLCVCLGYWTDEIYEAYEVEDLVKEFTILDPDEATILFIPLIIASRAILLQALGDNATLISIVIINLCGSPLFVFSPKMQKIIPPLIHFNPRDVALRREKIELLGRRNVENQMETTVQVEEWVIVMRSISIVLTESRLIVFFANLVSLSLAVTLLKGVTLTTTYISFFLVAMLPYFVGSALIPIIYIGKRLNLTDDDFRVVLLSWFVKLSSLLLLIQGSVRAVVPAWLLELCYNYAIVQPFRLLKFILSLLKWVRSIFFGERETVRIDHHRVTPCPTAHTTQPQRLDIYDNRDVYSSVNVVRESMEQESYNQTRYLSSCNGERRVSEDDSDIDPSILRVIEDDFSCPEFLNGLDSGLLLRDQVEVEQDDIVDDFSVDISFGSVDISEDMNY